MKTVTTILLALAFCFTIAAPASAQSTIPTFSITNVYPGESITILAHNFPANHVFDVLMGEIHTRGVGGIPSGSITTASSGAFTATLNIPDALRTSYQIAVRLQSRTKPNIFAYNWFYNQGTGYYPADPAPGSPLPSGKPSPYFVIAGAARDISVSITTQNFPLNHRFNALMGPMGTRGVNGVLVDTVTTGSSPSQTFTFNIPAALRGQPQIALRLESANGTSGYFAYNWFINGTYGNTGGLYPPPPVSVPPGTRVLPTLSITGVTRDTNVSIYIHSLPPNKNFEVRLGPLGTRGIGGALSTTFYSGSGGSLPLTVAIPAAVRGLPEIAIRIQTVDGSGYYAYNWFFNNSTH